MNRRRKLLLALGAGAIAAPLACFAQPQAKLRRVGFLYFASRQSALESGRYELFVQGMRELGYAEGKNYEVVARFADGVSERELTDFVASRLSVHKRPRAVRFLAELPRNAMGKPQKRLLPPV